MTKSDTQKQEKEDNMQEKEITDFFVTMYDNFGQFSVINFVKDRQENGQLLQATWKDCDGCDWHTPFISNACLVCGITA